MCVINLRFVFSISHENRVSATIRSHCSISGHGKPGNRDVIPYSKLVDTHFKRRWIFYRWPYIHDVAFLRVQDGK